MKIDTPIDLAGKVAIVTGAGSGIGRATALLMAARGAKVVVGTSRAESAAPVVAEIRAAGGSAEPGCGDMGDPATPQLLADAALAAWGRIDIIVNNAAITNAAFLASDTNVAEMVAQVWERSFAVNVIGPALLCKAVLPTMIAQGSGAIVNIASGRGVQGDLGLTAYGASKAALINLTLNLATQYGKQGIRANTIVVGMVLTPSVEGAVTSEIVDLLRAHHLTPDVGAPNDVAEVIAFLGSDAARFVTGATLAADGGITCHTAPYADFIKMYSAGGMLGTDAV